LLAPAEVVPVNIRHSFLGFGLAVGAASSAFAFAQEPAAQPPAEQPGAALQKKPSVIFRAFRDQYFEGKFDVAAESLKDFLAANPSDAELIDIENKYGATFLLGLRNLKQWSDSPTANEAAKKALEELIAKTQAATKKITQDPRRISALIRNLGASPEERAYAEIELRRSGAAAAAPMIEILRSTNDLAQRAGILGAVTKLGAEIIPPLLASLDGLPDDLKTGVVNAFGSRTDLLNLTGRADSDPTPYLWYFAGLPDGQAPTLRETSKRLLETLFGPIDRRRPADELVTLARAFVEKKAQYLGTDTATGRVRVWKWDAGTNNVRSEDVTPRQADEWFGLRNLKWAVERNPADDATKAAFVGYAAERAVENTNFGDLATANPAVYALLAATPTSTLNDLLERAIREQRAPLAFATVQALSARATKGASEPTTRASGDLRPALLVRALDFPDDRVQFAAAVALLRSPPTSNHAAHSKVIEVLKRAAAADPAPSGSAKALLADPAAIRSARVGEMFRQAGFDVESVTTTRDVLRRVSAASDVDLIVLDRHVHSPMIRDFLTQLRSIPSAKSIPVFVVASSDQTKPPAVEPLLVRLALLIAATETEDVKIPPAYAIDRRRTEKDNDAMKADALAYREKTIEALFETRLGRLKRLVAAANFPRSEALDTRLLLRLPQLTYAAMAAEYPVTKESAPDAYRKFENLTKLIASQPGLDKSVENLPLVDLIRLIQQLEAVLTPELQKKFELLASRIDYQSLALPQDLPRDAWLEDALTRDLKQFSGVRVIPEPYSSTAVEIEVKAADVPPPVPAAQKAAMVKSAIEWLRKCAIGEVVGYDVRPAEGVLRAALRSNDTAGPAIDALARIGTAESQQSLMLLAVTASRPVELRSHAADAAVRHIQQFGKFAGDTNVNAIVAGAKNETDPILNARLTVLANLIAGKSGDLADAIKAFSPASVQPPAAKPATPPMDPNAPKDGGVKPATPPAGEPKN
jgi:CheY-like chemotaxis protein